MIIKERLEPNINYGLEFLSHTIATHNWPITLHSLINNFVCTKKIVICCYQIMYYDAGHVSFVVNLIFAVERQSSFGQKKPLHTSITFWEAYAL